MNGSMGHEFKLAFIYLVVKKVENNKKKYTFLLTQEKICKKIWEKLFTLSHIFIKILGKRKK